MGVSQAYFSPAGFCAVSKRTRTETTSGREPERAERQRSLNEKHLAAKQTQGLGRDFAGVSTYTLVRCQTSVGETILEKGELSVGREFRG